VSNPRSNPADSSDREAGPSADLVREHVRVLRKRRDYVIGMGYERRRQGLQATLEFSEASALEFLLGIVEKVLDERGNR